MHWELQYYTQNNRAQYLKIVASMADSVGSFLVVGVLFGRSAVGRKRVAQYCAISVRPVKGGREEGGRYKELGDPYIDGARRAGNRMPTSA